MRYALDVDGQPVEITAPVRIAVQVNGELQGFIFTPEAIVALSDDERAGFGVRVITPAAAAEDGQVVVSAALAYEGETVVETAVYGPAPVPTRVPALYGVRALKAAGIYAGLMAFKAGLPADHDFHDYFDRATHWERSNAELMGAAGELDLTDEQVDDLFRAAEALRLADGAAA